MVAHRVRSACDREDESRPKESEVEEATILEVADDGTSVVVADGRRLPVNPGDISIACLWLPTSTLEISDPEEGHFFNLWVKLQGTDQKIRARWEA